MGFPDKENFLGKGIAAIIFHHKNETSITLSTELHSNDI